MAYSDTSIVNLALARIGAKRINSLSTDTTLEAIHGRTHYEHTRDALLRSHVWRFAMARAELEEDADAPDFEWDNQFILPADCLRVVALYDTDSSYVVEGERILTDDTEVNLIYIKRATDPGKFDPLFVEALALALALKLVMPLSQDKVLRRELEVEYKAKIGEARRMNKIETNGVGREDLYTWNDARDTTSQDWDAVTP